MPFQRIKHWINNKWQNRRFWKRKPKTVPTPAAIEPLPDLATLKQTIQSMAQKPRENQPVERVRSGAISRAVRAIETHTPGKRWHSEAIRYLREAHDELVRAHGIILSEHQAAIVAERAIRVLLAQPGKEKDLELLSLEKTARQNVRRFSRELLEVDGLTAQIEGSIPRQ